MAKYIDVDQEIAAIQKEIEGLKRKIKSHMPDREDGWIDHESQIRFYEAEIKDAEREIRMLKSYPAADVVEVVRCKDCKYGQLTPTKGCLCRIDVSLRDKDYYCSYGERREDAEIY